MVLGGFFSVINLSWLLSMSTTYTVVDIFIHTCVFNKIISTFSPSLKNKQSVTLTKSFRRRGLEKRRSCFGAHNLTETT